MKLFIVSLQSATDRRLQSERHAEKSGVPWQFVDAIDKQSIRLSHLPIRYDRRARQDLPAGAVACYFSHLKALRAVIESGLDYAAILEDDWVLDGDLKGALERVPKNFDHCQLHREFIPWGMPFTRAKGEHFELVRPTGLRTLGYVVTRRFAAELHDELACMHDHLDHSIRRLSKRDGFRFYQVSKQVVSFWESPSLIGHHEQQTEAT